MRAAIYARFSSDRQTEESIVAQVRACREYAEKRGLDVIKVYADEAISGKESKTSSRVQYQEMLKAAGRGEFDVILVHKFDRVARSLNEHVNLQARLNKWNVELVAVAQDFGGGAEAKIMKALMWSLSEYYIDNLAGEVRKGQKEIALQGKHNGGVPPFGYDVVDQQLVINPLEAEYVRRIFAACIAGSGYGEIIKDLDAAGITGKRGRPIRYPQIYEMLRNEKYAGVYLFSPTEASARADRRTKPDAIRIENNHAAIISKEDFAKVQEIMTSRKHAGKRNYLCSGLVYCSCGAKMHASISRRKGHEYPYYKCSKSCGAPVVKMETVDDAALAYLREILSDENQERIAASLREYDGSEADRLEGFQAAKKKRIKEKQAEYDALLKNLSSGALPPEVISDVGQRMKDLKDAVAALEAQEPPKDYTTGQIRAWLNSIKEAPTDTAVKLLIERIEVQKDTTAFNISSTLKTGVRNLGGGRGI